MLSESVDTVPLATLGPQSTRNRRRLNRSLIDSRTSKTLERARKRETNGKLLDDISLQLAQALLELGGLELSTQEASQPGTPHSPPETGRMSFAGAPSAGSSLLVSHLQQHNETLANKPLADQELIRAASARLQSTFNDIKQLLLIIGDGMLGYNIDWEMWTRVVNEYEEIVVLEPDTLAQAISSGIPKEVRGMVWQLVAGSKNFQLEELYATIKSAELLHSKQIKRDLTRTSFVTSSEAVGKIDLLYAVIKAYSVFDPEVGYTQGMCFIAVPLIINMNESEAFCLLVTLMKDYNVRLFFQDEMRGLHLLLYQFDRLLEDKCPYLYNHLVKQGVKLLMFALQWFLTFFAYKFPLEFVLRIYDVIITEGIEAVLKFALNLMIRNEQALLALAFDQLLEFLKNRLFAIYLDDDEGASNPATPNRPKRFLLMMRKSSRGGSPEQYKLNLFVRDAVAVEILPQMLAKYAEEFALLCDSDVAKGEDITKLKLDNGKLRNEIKLLESNYVMLDHENILVVNSMVHTKVLSAKLSDENHELEGEIAELLQRLKELEERVAQDNTAMEEVVGGTTYLRLPSNIEEEIQKAMDENLKVMDENRTVEEQLALAEKELALVERELKALGPKQLELGKWLSGWKK